VSEAKKMLDLAARLAMRAAGDVEPNPMVGCVIASGGRVIGMGHHRRFGGPHAEREALADCRRRGEDPRAATAYVTLEPCCHHGKTPPCTDALVEARIARVVAARLDPNPVSAGGAAILARAGIALKFSGDSPLATGLAAPFIKRTLTGLPWVIAKWAQTIDGRIATRAGESKWISGPAARARVHRLRARVDVILTGLGTVLADNPQLTARGVRRVRRVARRVVADAHLEIPLDCGLVTSARIAPVTVACIPGSESSAKSAALRDAGVEVIAVPMGPGGIDPRALLTSLVQRYSATNILVESGAGLLGALFQDDLVDSALVYIAPMLLGDELARGAAVGRVAPALADARRLTLHRIKRVGDDVELDYRRPR
jgi:diaminohydroxyphosphoribosylaminopyrimidine deaminase / 5-amino-6-(5-phosphoribosylamino)uracil reductase